MWLQREVYMRKKHDPEATNPTPPRGRKRSRLSKVSGSLTAYQGWKTYGEELHIVKIMWRPGIIDANPFPLDNGRL